MKMFWTLQLPCYDDDGLGGGGGGSADLTSVISGSLEGVDRGDPIGDDPAPALDAPPDPEENEIGLIEKEILAKTPGMANSTIKAHRHQAVLTRTRNLHEKALKEHQEKLAAAEARWEKHKWAEDPQIHEGLQLLAMAESDPEQFAEVVLADPRYSKILQLRQAAEEVQSGAGARNPMEGRPRPNARSTDGSYDYYDDAGIEELLSWHGQQVTTAAVKQAREELSKEFGPAVKDYQQRQAWNTALDTSKQHLEAARTGWPGFKEHEGKVKAALMADQNLSLHDAYIKVVVPEFQNATRVNRETLRKELLAELQGKPKAVTESTRQPERTAPGDGGKLTTEDIVRRSLAAVRE